LPPAAVYESAWMKRPRMKPSKKAAKQAAKPTTKKANPSKTPVLPPKSKSPAKSKSSAKAPEPVGETKLLAPRKRQLSEAKPARKRTPLVIPPILLEGDATAAPAVSGPGQRYVLGPTPPIERAAATDDAGELPESYGTERLWLTARDPHWLYASWDLSNQQQQRYNASSADGHLLLRAYEKAVGGPLIAQADVHPESRHWFVHVGRGGTKFVAELGYRDRGGNWKTIAISHPTLTPPDTQAEDDSVQFATLPPEVTFEELLEIVASAVDEHVPLIEAIQQLRTHGYTGLPRVESASRHEWTPAQARALAEVVSMDSVRRVWVGSLEITELVRRHMEHHPEQAVTSPTNVAISGEALPLGPEVSAISSELGKAPTLGREKGFWFNVNAEIVLYGATDPKAKIWIGDREIKLRADGTFSYRFALPDGAYDLPINAVSADREDVRSAHLHFNRSTAYGGDVGHHPQDKALRSPAAENIG
jgi:uncharacterized protein